MKASEQTDTYITLMYATVCRLVRGDAPSLQPALGEPEQTEPLPDSLSGG